MKSVFKCFALTILLSFVANSLFAVIAYPYPVEITQPDGTKLTIILKGDEHVKWAQTLDGYSILRNSKGVYEYAIKDSNGDMVPSGIKAKNVNERNGDDYQFLSKVSKGFVYSKSQVSSMKKITSLKQKGAIQPFPTKGNIKVVCILIGFTDKAFTKKKAEFSNLFNQIGYSTDGSYGSVYDYYLENSYGQLNLSFTVAGPYTASQNMEYYGANNPNDNNNDIRPRELVTEAVNLADKDINFANFDNNSDGYVDCVYVIHAGYGEEAGANKNTIWAHAWQIPPVIKDSKTVLDYSCSAELDGASGGFISTIGVVCHEFGHVMGAPDYYDIDYNESGGDFIGTGKWDIMADGSWNNFGATPAHHNPFTKIYIYNWATASLVNSTSNLTLNNAELFNNSFYRINTGTSNEYFLLENRQKHKFDSSIPGKGLLIYHVDENHISKTISTNDINIDKHQGIYPVCASSTSEPSTTVSSYGSINTSECPFPGLYAKTSFTDNTIPSMKSWAGANTNKPITNIAENTSNKTVSLTVTSGTGVNESDGSFYKLKQNFPNPFDNSTNIDFTLSNPSKIKLTVYNSLGQLVDVIVDDYLLAGDHSYPWTPKNVASGIYFYQLNIDGNKEVKRMVKR